MDCTIRKWQIDDQYDLAKILNNQKIMNHLRDGLPYPYTVEDAKEYISSMLQANQEKMFAFAISVDEHVIGSISVTRLDNIHYCTGELGYYIGEDYWGKGYATSAVKQVCQYVFEHSDIIRIFA